MRMYSLFYRDGKRWIRVANTGQYPKQQAIRIFQDRLINSAFTSQPYSLRPVAEPKSSKIPAHQQLCKRCESHLHTHCVKGDCACNCRMFNG